MSRLTDWPISPNYLPYWQATSQRESTPSLIQRMWETWDSTVRREMYIASAISGLENRSTR